MTTSSLPQTSSFAPTAELLLAANRHTQRLLEPHDGQLSPVNIRSARALLEDILKAQEAHDRADYDRVKELLEWAQ